MTSTALHHPLLTLATSALATPFVALIALQPPPAQAAPLQAPATPVHASATQARRIHAASTLAGQPPRRPPTRPPTEAVWPLEPRPEVVRGFDLPAKPWLSGHRGLDLAGSPGQQVFAATPGTITYSGPLAGRGVIVVTHGRLRTTYEPVIPTVRTGTAVTPGTPIAHLSAAGSHCPPRACLHWGLLKADLYLNPLSLLPTHPVRLLPHSPPDQPSSPLQPPDQRMPTLRPPARSNSQPPRISPTTVGQPQVAPTPAALTPPSPTPVTPTPSRTLLGPALTQAHTSTDPTGQVVASAVVSLAAAATIGASLLIRRH